MGGRQRIGIRRLLSRGTGALNPTFQQIEYRPLGAWPVEGVEWLILHDLDAEATFPTSFTETDKLYRLVKTYGFSGPVGWQWGLYRRADLWK